MVHGTLTERGKAPEGRSGGTPKKKFKEESEAPEGWGWLGAKIQGSRQSGTTAKKGAAKGPLWFYGQIAIKGKRNAHGHGFLKKKHITWEKTGRGEDGRKNAMEEVEKR